MFTGCRQSLPQTTVPQIQAMILVQVPDPLTCKTKDPRKWEKAQG